MPSLQETAQRAIGLYGARKFAEALPLLCEVLKAKPDHPQAREALVAAAIETKRQDEVLVVFREAANARRSVPELQDAIATLLLSRPGGSTEAEQHVRRALAIRPAGLTFQLLGVALSQQGRLDESNDAFRRACELEPTTARAWFNLGCQLNLSGLPKEALGALQRAAELAPRNPAVLGTLGRALHQSDRTAEALPVLRRAIAAGPNHVLSLTNLGWALVGVGQGEEGSEFVARAVRTDPHDQFARSIRAMSLNYISDDGRLLRDEHRAFGALVEAQFPELPPPPLPPPSPPGQTGRPLRVGFLSGDLREHSCARFLGALFDGLPGQGFEVFGLYNNRKEDAITARFKAAAQGWVTVDGLSASEGARAVRDAGIDVLVECSGFTAGNRLDICAARPAPVQMTFLGYPNTTGLSRIRYRLVDEITDPTPFADEYAVETLLRIPECLWCFRAAEGAPPVGASPAAKNGKVTIGCFNNMAKITPRALEAWAEVLRRVPTATLLFKNRRLGEPQTLAWLRGRFEALGVSGERIEAVAYVPDPADHLRVYDRIDFQLDTFPYNGTTTTCESFWQGVPIVALKGKVHAARVSMSLLHAVGLDDLVGEDIPGYVETAVALASDPGRLGRLRGEMRARMEASPLRDEKGYCERFGAVLREAWEGSARD